MQFTTTALVAILSAIAAASPLQSRTDNLCTSSFATALCCDLNVSGVVNMNCASPSTRPSSVDEFHTVCAAGGQQSSCCFVPLAGQALVCVAP
ncbi:hypothetical protein DSL72_001905 [Monilinia vaccinii-corymbosi]|uniref:Hydrophobin n=1 Tax=Monilinia vaccinii-corymbosi TaxID=61207 RepID=A0A8A3PB43_9HELO|nr:hypothetical protein DSL72_001905 [Monilinia vaccinii-corymbosi]